MKYLVIATAVSAVFLASVQAAEYSPYPKAGVYNGTDQKFERELTVSPDGRFTLEVMQKGAGGNLRSGSGSGKLADAPGGWDFSEGRCTMTLKRAAGGMKMHVEGCSSAWGDVVFDGLYKPAGEAATASASKNTPAQVVTAAVAPGTPSRKDLLNNWTDLQVFNVGGKSITAMARPMATDPKLSPIERYSQAAFILDANSNYAAMSATEQAKPPVGWVNIPLPELAANEGLLFQAGCQSGKSSNVIAINVTRLQGKTMHSRRHSAWMLDASLQAHEVKPATKVKCPNISSEY
ncbi:hypothetical protein [Leeia oryzae]|uniref:hypothetical protein n=1 Tax=Leeia oryzae TaxID=356662 RepID=UPI0003A48556|nr:hypothetical protein [Leeia oryzae]